MGKKRRMKISLFIEGKWEDLGKCWYCTDDIKKAEKYAKRVYLNRGICNGYRVLDSMTDIVMERMVAI